ncbi:hypothetical protein [Planktothricoides raciborskii]|uniref:Uncharacterized protein n=3 Tax=Planktothricoides raciborskii TaxID=132608 RepID=A0ABR8EDY5_9CYAN|nr:hypothetical protein [Planktothricoides raciborskii]MBD2543811.1 hypothetical protein [Planktothricoides raciborskii FACHB-1370]
MGGAIFIRSGTLNINNGSSLTNNHAEGGAINAQGFGGAIFALTQATIDAQKKINDQGLPASNELPILNISSDTTFSGNSAYNAATKTQQVTGTDLNTDAIFARTTQITTPTPNTPQTPAQITQTVKAKGQDGPIAGGTVFLDVNGNGIQDSGEPSSTTDAAGNFTLEITGDFDTNGNGILDPEEGQYVIVGGTDAITGQAFTGILKAVPGSTVVTPLTTLVATLVDTGLTPEEAQTLVKTSLGLPSTIDLATFDPIAAAQAGSSEGLQVLAAQVAVQATMTQLSASAEALDSRLDGVENALIVGLAIAIQEEPLNLSDANQIETLLKSALNQADLTLLDAADIAKIQQVSGNIGQLSQVIAASNAQILTATSAEDIFQAQKVAQTSVTEDLTAAFSGTKSFDEVVAENTGEALTAQIDAATINTSVLTENQSFSSLFFDSDYYLAKNPDVAAAVENGSFATALEHFGLFGAKEGRAPSYFFGETYLFDNPDVAAAVSDGALDSAVQHFLEYGYKEGRFPSDKLADFETFYLSQNPDAAAGVANGTYANALEYLMTEGLSQGETLLSEFNVVAETFDPEDYLAKNPDVAEAVTNGLFKNGLEHFVRYGMSEGRDPGEEFSNGDYLAENADVAAAVEGGAFDSGYEHYMMYGFKEGRPGTVEYDRLTGEPGIVDTFTLSLENEKDYTMISNFDAAEDIIQLPGSAADYQLAPSSAGLPPGTAIYRLDGELSNLVGLVRDVSSLSLGEGYFSFV